MASGIIEYLAEGTWTKRMHAGWAAQSGVRAALMARGGFLGPRTVLEGVHGVYRAFAPSIAPDFGPLLNDLGSRWVMQTIAFKPYACGTMTQPFVDCAIKLAEDGVRAADITDIVCEVAEGTVHRLWEPLAVKHRPPTPYAAKFSTPFCMAVGLSRSATPASRSSARRASTIPRCWIWPRRFDIEINPDDEYPRNFTGHLRATLKDGSQREFRQPYLRGGEHAPLSAAELETKFMNNARHGGWSAGAGGSVPGSLARPVFAAEARCARGVPHMTESRPGLVDPAIEDLAGRVAVVTGSSRNIGRAIALELAGAGAAVMVNARTSAAEAEAVAEEIREAGGRAAVKIADVADPQAAAALIAAAVESFGRLDILVNNAAVRREIDFAQLDYREWREITSIILDGAYLCSHAALPHLIASGSGADRQHRRRVGVYRRRRARACDRRQGRPRRPDARARARPRAAWHHGQLRGAWPHRHDARGQGARASWRIRAARRPSRHGPRKSPRSCASCAVPTRATSPARAFTPTAACS